MKGSSRSADHGERGALRTGTSASPFKEPVGPTNDAFEREADRVAEAVVRGNPASLPRPGWSGAAADPTIRRKCAECQEEEDEKIRRAPKDAAPVEQAEPAQKEPPPAQAAPALLVDDEGEVARGQMRKSEFMTTLRAEACGAVDAALTGTGRDSQGCPYIDYWFGYYEERSASQIERSLRRYAPEAMGAATARDYIRIVIARIRRSAEMYAKTGEIAGLPEDMPMSGTGGPLTAFGGMFFKARPGGARRADPVSVRDQLGSGRPLPGPVRDRMESAFGESLGGVRIHTDATGAELSDGLNARAFTVGRHVAFGRGEFRPGTLPGDALIAHELAHVVQQRGAADGGHQPKRPDAPLEKDADRSAASVVSSLWDRTHRSAARVRSQAVPALRSGLTLSRCGKSEREKEIERLGNVQYGFLEKQRKDEEERLKKEAEEDAKKKGLPPPTTTPKVDLADVTKQAGEKHSLQPLPKTEWESVVDKPAWKAFAAGVIAKVVASVKGTEVEPSLKGLTIVFQPEKALSEGFYAKFYPSSSEIGVGMSWIKVADKDPKNVWENIVHEGGGHRKYAATYSSEIMESALSKLPEAEQKRIKGEPGTETRRQFHEAYTYPETEIYAAVWQRRYQHPESGPTPETGGIDTDENIVKRLKVMQQVLEPTVAVAVLKELKRRIDANDQILARDRKFFVDKVKEVFKIDL